MWGKHLVLIIFILLLGSAVASAGEWKFDASKVHFYMYGMATCPHCQRMKKLIPETYGYDKFTYYELVNNDRNDRIFRNISRLTGITGVPAIGITYNGTLVAVIEGEFNVSATPEIVETAFEHNGTLLLVGGKAYLLPWNSSKAMKVVNELTEYFLNEKPTTTSSGKKGICGAGFIALAALIPVAVERRRE
jgi:glutaredoxin